MVTGGAGFIGHHLAHALHETGNDVLVIDDLSTGIAARLPADVPLERRDIAVDDLEAPLRAWKPDTVFHLAAQASVPVSMARPEFDLRVNALGTLRLLQALRATQARRIVFVSSGGALYGEMHEPAAEDAPVRPSSYYGFHKLLAEHYVVLGGLPYAIARPANVYGPGQDMRGEGGVIASFVGMVRHDEPLTIHGDGTQRRDFVSVHDVVRALILLAHPERTGVWNVSSGTSLSVLDVAAALDRVVGRALPRRFTERRPGDIHSSRLSSGRLNALGWQPLVDFETGLREVLSGAERAAG